MNNYNFPCGCSFPLTDIVLEDGRPSVEFTPDISNINLDCHKTWELIGTGNTTGCFQLESRLGQSLARKLKPTNIEQLAGLITVMRPGPLNGQLDNKSIAQRYIDRKNGEEEIKDFHPALKDILKDTYSLCIYQESILSIAKEIAGFTMVEADVLRKAFSKKKPEEMAALKDKFIDGCERLKVVTKEEGIQLFDLIEKFQRYGFNKSITGDAVVSTFNGNITIKNISVGEYIRAPKNLLEDHYVKIINKYDHGLQDVYTITLENGLSITSTLEHKFLCQDNKQYKLKDILNNKELKIICYHNLTKEKSFKIIDIFYNGIRQTYDLEIDDPQHVYYANGIATSNSHAVSYAMNTYLSAYAKAHFTRAFFTAYLRNAQSKPKPYQEVNTLVQNARLMGIKVQGPDFRYLHPHFKLTDKIIRFGFLDIKGIGQSVWKRMNSKAALKCIEKDVKDWNWMDFLLYYSDQINSTAFTAMINSGSLDYLGISRTRMVYEYETFNKLTVKEKNWVNDHIVRFDTSKITLLEIFRQISSAPSGFQFCCHTAHRKSAVTGLYSLLLNPPHCMDDSPAWISSIETSLFGVSITCSEIDGCDTSAANCTCLEFVNGNHPKVIIIAAKINRVNEIKTKSGQNKGRKMAFLEIGDITSNVDSVVVFPETWESVKHIVYENNNVLVSGEKGKDNSLIVKNMWQI